MIGRPTFRKSINRSTQLQTVEIRLPGRPHEQFIHSLEHYPICPVEIPKCQPVFIETPNGDTYMWDEADGSRLLYQPTEHTGSLGGSQQ